jgi:hypothetical protein
MVGVREEGSGGGRPALLEFFSIIVRSDKVFNIGEKKTIKVVVELVK